MRQVMCGCAYTCIIIVMGMYKNQCYNGCMVRVLGIPSVCIFHIMHITRVYLYLITDPLSESLFISIYSHPHHVVVRQVI